MQTTSVKKPQQIESAITINSRQTTVRINQYLIGLSRTHSLTTTSQIKRRITQTRTWQSIQPSQNNEYPPVALVLDHMLNIRFVIKINERA